MFVDPQAMCGLVREPATTGETQRWADTVGRHDGRSAAGAMISATSYNQFSTKNANLRAVDKRTPIALGRSLMVRGRYQT